MRKLLFLLMVLPLITVGQNYRLDSITGSNGLLIYSLYDNSGNAIKDYYKYSTIDWKYENSFDINNNKTEVIIFENNGGSWDEFQRFTYIYNNNQIVTSEYFTWSSGSGQPAGWIYDQKAENSYINNDLVLAEMYSWDGGQWNIIQKSEYNYTNNNQDLVLTSNWDGTTWSPIAKTERVFLNNNLSTETYSSYSGVSWSISFSASYSCNNTLLNNTIYGLTMADFSQFSDQVTEMVYSFGDTYTYHYSNYSPTNSIEDISSVNKEVLKVIDIAGREVKVTINQPLIYIYNDGSVKRKMILE